MVPVWLGHELKRNGHNLFPTTIFFGRYEDDGPSRRAPSFCIICWPRLAKARQAVGNLVTKVECPPTLCNCLPLINTSSIYLLETREWAQDHAQTRMKTDWLTVGVSSESLNMHSRVNVTEGMNCVHTFQMPFLSALAYNTRGGNDSACTIHCVR